MKRLLLCIAFVAAAGGHAHLLAPQRGATKGPLRVHPANPRYFTDGSRLPDGSLKAVYVTGSHTWNSLVDMGRTDPPEAFDFDAYLDFLDRHGHNFIRLWTWDSSVWDTRANAKLGKDFVHTAGPLPWMRTGREPALDAKPKFDLTAFNPAYFERLRTRVRNAGRRGIYVSVMLFEGWGLMHGNRGRAAPAGVGVAIASLQSRQQHQSAHDRRRRRNLRQGAPGRQRESEPAPSGVHPQSRGNRQ